MEQPRLIDIESFLDHRGSLISPWNKKELEVIGINFIPDNCVFTTNHLVGTIRGLHFQSDPWGQSKLVFCLKGAIMDVVVDINQQSETYLQPRYYEVDSKNNKALFIPKGYAHGYQTLCDETILGYLIEGNYNPAAGRILRWNDPVLNIKWPKTNYILSDKDNAAEFIK